MLKINNAILRIYVKNSTNYLIAHDTNYTYTIVDNTNPDATKSYLLYKQEDDLPPFKVIEFENIEEIKDMIHHIFDEFQLYDEDDNKFEDYIISCNLQTWREGFKNGQTYYQIEGDSEWLESLPITQEIEEKFCELISEKQNEKLLIPDLPYESETYMTQDYYNKSYIASFKILSSYNLEELKVIFEGIENIFEDFNIGR